MTKRRINFGRGERIFYGEFNGRCWKRVLVKIIGEYDVARSSRLSFSVDLRQPLRRSDRHACCPPFELLQI